MQFPYDTVAVAGETVEVVYVDFSTGLGFVLLVGSVHYHYGGQRSHIATHIRTFSSLRSGTERVSNSDAYCIIRVVVPSSLLYRFWSAILARNQGGPCACVPWAWVRPRLGHIVLPANALKKNGL